MQPNSVDDDKCSTIQQFVVQLCVKNEADETVLTAFRIHISSETKDKLDSLGGYQTQYRGEVELKVGIIY